MTIAGWIVMCVSVGSVLSLVGFCLYRVLSLPPADIGQHLKGPLDLDTGNSRNMD